jgi:ABC-type Zn uptake system ZnuABC Zn-binding protein ZnuA
MNNLTREWFSKLLLLIYVCASLTLTGCNQHRSSKILLIATTTHIQSALQSIGGKHVEVTLLVPPSSCPGHYDFSPTDVAKVSQSKAVFMHGYEKFVPRLLEAVSKHKPKVYVIDIKGNWLVPNVQTKALRSIAAKLSELDPKHKHYYNQRLTNLLENNRLVAKNLQNLCKQSNLNRYAVISSDQQLPVLKWMGLRVVGTYGRPEDLTPLLLHNLVRTARQQNVRLVVDNLQSGPSAGMQLAQDIDAVHVTLSNFPGGFPNTNSWELCLQDNVKRVLTALKPKE